MKYTDRLNNNKFDTYSVGWWLGDPEDIPSYSEDSKAGLDTEGYVVDDGEDPETVIMQVAYPHSLTVHLVNYDRIKDYIAALEEKNPGIEIWMHNAGYDLDAVGWDESEFLKNKVYKGQIRDTGIRYFLRRCREGYPPKYYVSLNDICKHFFDFELEKKGSTRTGFTKDRELTRKERVYAALDAVVTVESARCMPVEYPTELTNIKGNIGGYYLKKNGIKVDREYQEKCQKEFEKERDHLDRVLEVFGYVPGVEGNESICEEILHEIEKSRGITLPRTPSGQISKTEESINKWDIDHPFITAYKRRSYINTILSAHINRKFISDIDSRVHPYFNCMLPTERFSSSKPNVQNPHKADGIRGQYVPEEGNVLIGSDYSQVELCALAESNFKAFGYSLQGDKINKDVCIHTDMAGDYYNIPYDELKRRRKEGDKEADKMRDNAKVPNFGYPGGMGPLTLYKNAQADGHKDYTVDMAREMKDLWFEKNPEMKDHLNPEVDKEFTDKEVRKYCRKHNIELKKYNLENLRKHLENEEVGDVFGEIKHLQRFRADTYTGFTVRNRTYCQACNVKFQAPAAEGGKEALFDLIMNGFKVVNFIHDEFLAEIPLNDNLQENVRRFEDIMVGGMKKIVPDYKIKCESALMMRWAKEADSVYDDRGNLCIWRPDGEDNKVNRIKEPDLDLALEM